MCFGRLSERLNSSLDYLLYVSHDACVCFVDNSWHLDSSQDYMYVFSHDVCVCFVDGVLSLLRAAKITCAIFRIDVCVFWIVFLAS